MAKHHQAENIGWNLAHSYTELPSLFYSLQHPEPVHEPKLVKLNASLADALGLDVQALTVYAAHIFSGNELPDQAKPLAQAYAGHQFGSFTMLGDGRAILFGEQITPQGERFDISFKGSGRTPYSRGGDGRAVLGPMLREYMISEAMHGLRIPTTRSLAVVTTGEQVYREAAESGAVLTRVARSHLRVGTFQYAANWGSIADLRTLTDYALTRHDSVPEATDERALHLLRQVMKRQASLVAQWQLVGFIHGVMNTDNMTISGETIDYGPCAFMDTYDPATVFSSIDRNGRYAYGNQPQIAAWNLARFAESLLPILHTEETQAIKLAEEALKHFPDLFHQAWYEGMRAKLGLFHEEPEDQQLIHTLLKAMEEAKADYTNTFRALTLSEQVEEPLATNEAYQRWHAHWQQRLAAQAESLPAAHELMRSSNPAVIPRNYLVEEAIEAANQGNLHVMNELLAVLAEPYAYTDEQIKAASLPPVSTTPYRTFCGT